MKRVIKNVIYFTTIILLLSGIRLSSGAYDTSAAPTTDLPARETIAVDEVSSIELSLAGQNEDISDVVSSNKKLIVRVVEKCEYKETGGKWYVLSLYSAKAGKYKIYYTYTDAYGNSSRKFIKVNVTKEEPCKSVTLKGKSLSSSKENILTIKKGRLSVRMNKGYKLKKIEIESYTYDSSNETEIGDHKSEWVTKKVKNNKVIKLSTTPNKLVFNGINGFIKSTTGYAESRIIITYSDKYSKKIKTITYYVYKKLV